MNPYVRLGNSELFNNSSVRNCREQTGVKNISGLLNIKVYSVNDMTVAVDMTVEVACSRSAYPEPLIRAFVFPVAVFNIIEINIIGNLIIVAHAHIQVIYKIRQLLGCRNKVRVIRSAFSARKACCKSSAPYSAGNTLVLAHIKHGVRIRYLPGAYPVEKRHIFLRVRALHLLCRNSCNTCFGVCAGAVVINRSAAEPLLCAELYRLNGKAVLNRKASPAVA